MIRLLLAFQGLCLSGLVFADSLPVYHDPDPESVLFTAVDAFRNGDIPQALGTVESLIEQVPNYRLAHLVHGDLLAAMAGQPVSLAPNSTLAKQDIDPLLHEFIQRFQGRSFEPEDQVPSTILRLAPQQKHAVVVDLSMSRLFVFQNAKGHPRLVRNYYVSVGKNGSRKKVEGDRRTPLGVYKVTERLPGDSLPDKYGPVAFPVDYPNQWDKRLGNTGSGIWLHGMPSKNFSRPPLDSDGCVALTNADLLELAPMIEPGKTPVIIADQLEWVKENVLDATRGELNQALESWRQNWQEDSIDSFLGFYAEDFQSRGMDIDAWRANRRNAIQGSGEIQVLLSDISMFAYPEEPGLIQVSFNQQYDSPNFSSEFRKRQYWRKKNGRWQIVFEGV